MAQSDTAVQYLTWALEEIEKLGHPDAALHVRMALDELRGLRTAKSNRYTDEAKRFRDKADEAEQLIELATTASRRASLVKVAESYRLMAAHLEPLSEPKTKPKNK